MYIFKSDLILPMLGCPVVCHGLRSAYRLNRKLGDVRSIHKHSSGMRYAVRFEDGSLKPVSVKPGNLRIVIDLPDREYILLYRNASLIAVV